MDKKERSLLARVVVGLVAVFLFSAVVPALLSAANDLGVLVGIFIVVVTILFVCFRWQKIFKFFGIDISELT